MPKLAFSLWALFVATAGIMVALLLVLPVAGWRIDTVYSGSMEPAISTGSVVFTRPVAAAAIRPGDVIMFRSGGNSFVHRVLAIDEGPPYSFVTRGDANEDPDSRRVGEKDLEGIVVLSVPYLGYASHAAKTAPGIALFFVVPGLMIIGSGIRALRQEHKKRHTRQPPLLSNGIVIAVPAVAVLLLASTGIASGSYCDQESTSGYMGTFSSICWLQTTQSHFEAGVISGVNTTAQPGNVTLDEGVMQGTVASIVFDTRKSGAQWDGLIWDSVIPGGANITFEVRASNTAFSKADASPAWTAVSQGSPVISGLPAGRYKQWRATLVSSSGGISPLLKEVRVYHRGTTPPPISPW